MDLSGNDRGSSRFLDRVVNPTALIPSTAESSNQNRRVEKGKGILDSSSLAKRSFCSTVTHMCVSLPALQRILLFVS